MEKGAIRRSSRSRGPPKDSFADEFIGDQWKQMRCDPKKSQNHRDANGASLDGDKSHEQIKLELACVMQQVEQCKENISNLCNRKSDISLDEESTHHGNALPIDFELSCWKEQMNACMTKIDALNTRMFRSEDLTADGGLQTAHDGVPGQPSKIEIFRLEGVQTKRHPGTPFDLSDSRFAQPDVLVACAPNAHDEAAHTSDGHAPSSANHLADQVTKSPLLSMAEVSHHGPISSHGPRSEIRSMNILGTMDSRGDHSILNAFELALGSSVATAKENALPVKDGQVAHVGGKGFSPGPINLAPCNIKFADLFKDNHVQNVSLDHQSKSGESVDDKSSIREDLKEVSLDFVPHGPRNENFHLKIPSELIKEGKKEWQSTLVGHFVGKKRNPPFNIVYNTTKRLWDNKGLIDTIGNSGFYFFTFSSLEERDAVLEGGPWYILGQPLILSPWKPNMKLSKEEVHSIPIWVNLFGIPLELWNRKGISFIASYLGKPLRMDRVTASRRHVSFARVCVEVSGAHDLLTKFALETEDEMGGIVLTDITVEYQWTPPRCAKCFAFGHDCSKDVTPKLAPARRISRRHPPRPSSYSKKPEIGEWIVVKGKGKGKLVESVGAPQGEGNMFSVLSPDVDQGQSEVVVSPLGTDLGIANPSHHPSTGFDTGREASSSPPEEGCDVYDSDYEEGPPFIKKVASNRQKKQEAKIKFSGSRPKGRHRN